MSKDYISVERLRQFVENITTAEEVAREDVDYFLAVKDGRIYRVEGLVAPYLIVSPSEVQFVSQDVAVVYEVQSNVDWNIE